MDIVKRNELLLIISKYAKKQGEVDPSDPKSLLLRFDACSVHIRKTGVSAEIRPNIFPAWYDIQEDDDSTYYRMVFRGTRNGLLEVGLETFVLKLEQMTEEEKRRLEKVDPAYVHNHLLFKEDPQKRKATEKDRSFFDFLLQYCAGKCQAPKIAEDYDNVT
jgi:hypothetical protein